MILTTAELSTAYPGACCGFLAVSGAANPASHAGLEQAKLALEADLRRRYPDAQALSGDPVLQAYAAYYRRFKKTYHVLLQLESVAQKGKSIPSVAGLVECMFMAELHNRLLTAVHDLTVLDLPLTVGVTRGGEKYTLMRGTEQECKPGDLYMYDRVGITSTIIYGPDLRTQVTAQTRAALFAVYAPPGIGAEAVRAHLGTILHYVRIIAPEAQVELEEVVE